METFLAVVGALVIIILAIFGLGCIIDKMMD
jgi:hypothetical protein